MLFSGNESCILNKSYILPFAFYCGLIFFFVYIWKQLDFFFLFWKICKIYIFRVFCFVLFNVCFSHTYYGNPLLWSSVTVHPVVSREGHKVISAGVSIFVFPFWFPHTALSVVSAVFLFFKATLITVWKHSANSWGLKLEDRNVNVYLPGEVPELNNDPLRLRLLWFGCISMDLQSSSLN